MKTLIMHNTLDGLYARVLVDNDYRWLNYTAIDDDGTFPVLWTSDIYELQAATAIVDMRQFDGFHTVHDWASYIHIFYEFDGDGIPDLSDYPELFI